MAAIIDRAAVSNSTTSTDAINTQSASTLDRGAWFFTLRNDYYQYHIFSNAELLHLSANTGRTIESDNYYNVSVLNTSYGLTDNFTIGINLPFTRLANIREGTISINDDGIQAVITQIGNSQGFSDMGIFGQWLFYDNHNNQLSTMLTFGTTVPTGRAHLRGNDGEFIAPIDQPGRGTWAPYIGMAVSKQLNKDSLNANIFFTKGLIGAQNANLGDAYDYDLAFVHKIFELNTDFALDGILELNGEYYSKTIIDGMSDPDSGANIIYIAPGLRLTLPHGLSPYLSTSIPVIQSINGIQSAIRYVITCGIDLYVT